MAVSLSLYLPQLAFPVLLQRAGSCLKELGPQSGGQRERCKGSGSGPEAAEAAAVAEDVAWLRAAMAAAKSGSEAKSPCADARLNCTLRELSAIRV